MNKTEIILFFTAVASLTLNFVFYRKQNKKPAAITYIDGNGEKARR